MIALSFNSRYCVTGRHLFALQLSLSLYYLRIVMPLTAVETPHCKNRIYKNNIIEGLADYISSYCM